MLKAFDDMVCKYNDLENGVCTRATEGTRYYRSNENNVLLAGDGKGVDTVPVDCWCNLADMVSKE